MKTKLKIIALIFFSIFHGCKKDKEFTTVEINVDNAENEIIFISGNDFLYEKKILSNSFRLKDTLSLNQNGYYVLSLGQSSIPLYIQKKDHIEIQIDAKGFPNAVEYTGETKKINTYLLEKQLSKNVDFKLSEKDFLQKMNSRKNSQLSKTADLSRDFREVENNELEYEYQNNLILYSKIHPHLTKDPNFAVSENYLAEVKDFKYQDTTNFQNSITYQSTVKSYYEWLAQEKLSNYNGQFKLAFLKCKLPLIRTA
ncbi:hypothetical protein LY54_03385 [Salegentibacter mishustinae]|uniref:hypothetical protein n=1 Tax=Salegentibacter mishustinae TaxID=270918 RepID=UPI000CCEE160|nr:hypothetical protein [Salegentibacter mishustinae]PNW21127.1 hypothetical protein APB85_07625 [Salegentibacter mishustinae]PZX59556.1 hypothetical protein LY54_03385 [Salegentibacter mishustinae]GGX01305.1 hypothetical protein GCM10008086_32760 [Salegentibacter mishustinae]